MRTAVAGAVQDDVCVSSSCSTASFSSVPEGALISALQRMRIFWMDVDHSRVNLHRADRAGQEDRQLNSTLHLVSFLNWRNYKINALWASEMNLASCKWALCLGLVIFQSHTQRWNKRMKHVLIQCLCFLCCWNIKVNSCCLPLHMPAFTQIQ